MIFSQPYLSRSCAAQDEQISGRFASAIRALVIGLSCLLGGTAVHADEPTHWSETTSFDFEDSGYYNGSFVSILTSRKGNSVFDINSIRSSRFVNSFNDNAGLILANQDSGILNNQVNVQSVVVGGFLPVGLVSLATLGLSQAADNTTVTKAGVRTNVISGSFRRTTGVVTVNQSSGSLNSSVNVFSFALGISTGPVALTTLDDTSLADISPQNHEATQETTSKHDVIKSNSFDGFVGSAQVTQTSGDQNTIRNTVSYSFTVRRLQ